MEEEEEEKTEKTEKNKDTIPRSLNKLFIDKYKLSPYIITSKYTDKDGIAVDGIVSPLKIDNRQLCSPPDNQYELPHCAGFATSQIAESLYWRLTGKLVKMEASQIYAKAKELDGQLEQDGTTLESALKAAISLCAFGDKLTPLLKVKTINVYPGFLATKEYQDEFVAYIKHLIHQNSYILLGLNITDSWYYCDNKNYKIKYSDDDAYIGGHAVVGCGYDKNYIYIQNSWGKEWGYQSFCMLSWEAFVNQCISVAWVNLSMFDEDSEG